MKDASEITASTACMSSLFLHDGSSQTNNNGSTRMQEDPHDHEMKDSAVTQMRDVSQQGHVATTRIGTVRRFQIRKATQEEVSALFGNSFQDETTKPKFNGGNAVLVEDDAGEPLRRTKTHDGTMRSSTRASITKDRLSSSHYMPPPSTRQSRRSRLQKAKETGITGDLVPNGQRVTLKGRVLPPPPPPPAFSPKRSKPKVTMAKSLATTLPKEPLHLTLE